MKTVNLALQGGGSHGAFTWGVLDALLQDGSLAFPGISGTSAGAVNAVALAGGWAAAQRRGDDPRQGARATLRSVWEEVAALGAYGALQRDLVQALFGPVMPFALRAPALGFNPLAPLLQRHVDFGLLGAEGVPRVFVGATHVRSGRATIFSGRALTLEAVLASACLPQLFPPVSIEGELYWDGGYSANPPLSPFLHGARGGDVLLVQINPVLQAEPPRTPQAIAERANELAFNAGLLSQVRAVEHVNQLVHLGLLPREQGLRLHRIDGGRALQRFPQSTRGSADAGLVRELFALGHEAAAQWLATHAASVGLRGTLPYDEYADDTWLRFAAALRPRRWWRRWRA